MLEKLFHKNRRQPPMVARNPRPRELRFLKAVAGDDYSGVEEYLQWREMQREIERIQNRIMQIANEPLSPPELLERMRAEQAAVKERVAYVIRQIAERAQVREHLMAIPPTDYADFALAVADEKTIAEAVASLPAVRSKKARESEIWALEGELKKWRAEQKPIEAASAEWFTVAGESKADFEARAGMMENLLSTWRGAQFEFLESVDPWGRSIELCPTKSIRGPLAEAHRAAGLVVPKGARLSWGHPWGAAAVVAVPEPSAEAEVVGPLTDAEAG